MDCPSRSATRLRALVDSLARSERGNALVGVTFLLPLLLLGVGGAMDGLQYVAAKKAVQIAADNAAKAGLKAYQDKRDEEKAARTAFESGARDFAVLQSMSMQMVEEKGDDVLQLSVRVKLILPVTGQFLGVGVSSAFTGYSNGSTHRMGQSGGDAAPIEGQAPMPPEGVIVLDNGDWVSYPISNQPAPNEPLE